MVIIIIRAFYIRDRWLEYVVGAAVLYLHPLKWYYETGLGLLVSMLTSIYIPTTPYKAI